MGLRQALRFSGGGALPSITVTPANLTPGAATGSAAGAASCGGYTGAWSMTTTAPLAINSSSGALTTTGAVAQGSYTATLSFAFTAGGQTYSVSAPVSVAVAAPAAPAVPAVTILAMGLYAPLLGAF